MRPSQAWSSTRHLSQALAGGCPQPPILCLSPGPSRCLLPRGACRSERNGCAGETPEAGRGGVGWGLTLAGCSGGLAVRGSIPKSAQTLGLRC